MSYCLKVFVFSFCFLVLLGGISVNVLGQEAEQAATSSPAQEAISAEAMVAETENTEDVKKAATEAVNLDENIQPKDLGVGEPNLLPNSRFYFLKNWGRGISSFFTFNPIAKAELKLKFANEKLIEAKKLAEKTNDPKLLNKAINNFQEEENRLKSAVQKIKQGTENPKVDQFMDRFIEQGLRQQKLLGKFEQELPAGVRQNLMSVKEETLSKFSDINLKLASPEIFAEKINKIVANQAGSEFRQFKNLEILNNLKERVPETAKPAIERAIDNSLTNLKEDMEKMGAKEREKFKDYLFSIGGNEVRHLSVIDQLASRDITNELRREMEAAKEKVFEKIEKQLESYKEKNLQKTGEKLLEHLNTGEMGGLRTIKDLENNLSQELTPKILEIKRSAKEKLVKSLGRAETPEEQNKIFDEIEDRFYDVRQLEIFKEIEEIIPPEKQEFFEAMKEKAIKKMEEEIRGTKNNEAGKGQAVEEMAGETSEGIEILQESGMAPELIQEITKETLEKISRKIKNIQDPEKIEGLKQDLEKNKKVKEIIKKNLPKFFEKLEEKRESSLKGLDKARVEEQIKKAKEAIALCEKEINGLGEEVKKEIIGFGGLGLLEANKKQLEISLLSFREDKIGEAFGRATAVLNNASQCQKLINKIQSKNFFEKERKEEFKRALDKFREETPGAEISEEIISGTDVAARCPMLMPPTPDTCKGKWVVEKNSNGCPIFKCLIASGEAGEISCAKQGEKVNRNPLMGPVNQKCCPDLFEARVSKSYSVCQNEKIEQQSPSAGQQPSAGYKPATGLSNPASVYCQKMGYKLEIRTKDNVGQYGVCIFPDGRECEEWVFFRGECGKEYRKEDASAGQFYPSSDSSTGVPSAGAGDSCVQIITSAIGPEGICKEFPTPCAVPKDWKKVDRCLSSGTTAPQSGTETNSLYPSSQGR